MKALSSGVQRESVKDRRRRRQKLHRSRWFNPLDPLPTESRNKGLNIHTEQTLASQLSTIEFTAVLCPYCMSHNRPIHVKISMKDDGIKRGPLLINFTSRDSNNCCSLALQQPMNSSYHWKWPSCSPQRLQSVTLANGWWSWVWVYDPIPQTPPPHLVKLKYQTAAEASKQAVHLPQSGNKENFSFQHGGKAPSVPVRCLS